MNTAYETRLGEARYDTRLRQNVEGRYRTLGREVGLEAFKGNIGQALQNLLLPLYSYKKAIEKGNLTEAEVYNMRKNVTEIILAAAMFMMYSYLRGGDDEEKRRRRKTPMMKTVLTLLNRTSGDLTNWLTPGQFQQMAKNPFPAAKLVNDLISTIGLIPASLYYEAEGHPEKLRYKTGSRKGDIKLLSKSLNVIPGVKSALDLRRIFNPYELEELN